MKKNSKKPFVYAKAAAYLRLSKEEFINQKESNSITNQKQIINNYLKEHK